MKISRRTLIILALFSVLFLLTQWLFVPSTYLQSRLGQALQAPKVFLQALRSRHQVVASLAALTLENQSLRAQLSELANRPQIINPPAGGNGKSYIYARVYSSYPFNNADRLLINAGAEQGVVLGATALVAPGIFLGEVVRVNERTSEIRTIYDPGFEIPVKIGSGGIDALFAGGHEAKLTLISKKQPAQSGQTVVTTAKQYPYGLLLGTVKEPIDSADNLFQEARLETSYSISELVGIYILE